MTKLFRSLVPAGLILLTSFAIKGEINHFTILANKPGAEIQPTMYGLFFEDINYAADGGLYAEMIKNRSFEFPQSFMGWNTFGNISLKDDGPFERNPHYVRLGAASHQEKRTDLITKDSSVFHLKPVKSIDSPCGRNSRQEAF